MTSSSILFLSLQPDFHHKLESFIVWTVDTITKIFHIWTIARVISLYEAD